MPVLTKALIGIFMITLVTITTGFSSAPQHPPKDSTTKIGQPWYGGKPRPPVTIAAPAIEPVAPDSNVEVTFTITPDTECTALKYRLRGTNGITVLKETKKGKLECAAGVPTAVTAVVHVPAKTQGSVVLSVLFEKDGKDSATTRSIAVATTDALTPRTKKSAGSRKDSSSVSEETYAIEPADSRKR